MAFFLKQGFESDSKLVDPESRTRKVTFACSMASHGAGRSRKTVRNLVWPIEEERSLFTSIYLFSYRKTFLAYISVSEGDLFCHPMLGELLPEKQRRSIDGAKRPSDIPRFVRALLVKFVRP